MQQGHLFHFVAHHVLQVLDELHLVTGVPVGFGAYAEHPLEIALGDLVGHGDIDHEGGFEPFGGLGGGQGHGALVATDHGYHLFLLDQAFHLADADVWLALAVAQDQLQFGPTQRLDAPGGIDLLEGHLDPVADILAHLG